MSTNNVFGCRQSQDKIGVLIAQLGTPDAPTSAALRPYLKQFLSDRRVIEVNRVLWWFILNGIILRTRPQRSAKLYKRVWTDRGSPLLKTTEMQGEKLKEKLRTFDPSIEVEIGMRYGSPSLESALDLLQSKGCKRILLFPMYPQYAAATTASTYDAVFPHLLKSRWVPTLRVAEPYFIDRRYIESLAFTINEGLEKLSYTPDRLLLSYHGVPERYVRQGDPYCCMCVETTEALRPLLKFEPSKIQTTFQSRFGKEPWLRPYTDQTIEELGTQGVKKLAVACPGFTTDCLETIDEIGHEALETFREHGGEELKLIPCLNDHPVWIQNMSSLVVDELGSWLRTGQHCSTACATCPMEGCA